MPALPKSSLTVERLVELLLPLLLVTLLIVMCMQLLVPFVGLLIWTVILAVCFYPLHLKLKKRVGNRLSASIIGIGLSALILVPTAIAAASAAGSVPKVIAAIQTGERRLPPAPARLQELPLVGERAHALWTQAETDMPAFVKQYKPQLATFAKGLVGFAGGLFMTVLLFVGAIIFAAITLAYSDRARAFLGSILTRITGNRASGEHYMSVIGATIRSVANGVIGVAFVQALLCGIGFFVIGVPGAGLLSILAMALGPHHKTGKRYVVSNNEGIGWGATHRHDGANCLQHPSTSTERNTPIEVLERQANLFHEALELIPNSGGKGQYRGGVGIRQRRAQR